VSFTQIPTSGFTDASITEAKRSTDVITVTSTTYTLAASDAGALLSLDSASAITVTVPANSTAAIDTGTSFRIAQTGAGTVTFSPAMGVTIEGLIGSSTLGQYSVVGLVKRATDDWLLAPAT